jgi:hypothetical protein
MRTRVPKRISTCKFIGKQFYPLSSGRSMQGHLQFSRFFIYMFFDTYKLLTFALKNQVANLDVRLCQQDNSYSASRAQRMRRHEKRLGFISFPTTSSWDLRHGIWNDTGCSVNRVVAPHARCNTNQPSRFISDFQVLSLSRKLPAILISSSPLLTWQRARNTWCLGHTACTCVSHTEH